MDRRKLECLKRNFLYSSIRPQSKPLRPISVQYIDLGSKATIAHSWFDNNEHDSGKSTVLLLAIYTILLHKTCFKFELHVGKFVIVARFMVLSRRAFHLIHFGWIMRGESCLENPILYTALKLTVKLFLCWDKAHRWDFTNLLLGDEWYRMCARFSCQSSVFDFFLLAAHGVFFLHLRKTLRKKNKQRKYQSVWCLYSRILYHTKFWKIPCTSSSLTRIVIQSHIFTTDLVSSNLDDFQKWIWWICRLVSCHLSSWWIK